MQLYRVVNRELVHVRQLDAAEIASLGNDWDSWLSGRGYGRDYTLRRGIVREMTARERAALHREVAALKAQGKLPSAGDAILHKLARRAT